MIRSSREFTVVATPNLLGPAAGPPVRAARPPARPGLGGLRRAAAGGRSCHGLVSPGRRRPLGHQLALAGLAAAARAGRALQVEQLEVCRGAALDLPLDVAGRTLLVHTAPQLATERRLLGQELEAAAAVADV